MSHLPRFLLSRVWQIACLLCLLCWLPFMSQAQSSEAKVTRIEPEILDQQLMLDVDFQLSLGVLVRDAVERGVPLHFAVDLEISSPRWVVAGQGAGANIHEPAHHVQYAH